MAVKAETRRRLERIAELERLINQRQDDMNVVDANFRFAKSAFAATPEGERARQREMREAAVAYAEAEAERLEHQIERKRLLLDGIAPPVAVEDLERLRAAAERAKQQYEVSLRVNLEAQQERNQYEQDIRQLEKTLKEAQAKVRVTAERLEQFGDGPQPLLPRRMVV